MAVCIRNGQESASHSVYNVSFYDKTITTTVTKDPDVVRQWISKIEQINRADFNRLTVGLDVEFSCNSSYPVAVVKLCVAERCLVYQIFQSPFVPAAIALFLNNLNYTFVGVNVKSNLEKLQGNYSGLGGGAKYVELGKLAAKVYYCEYLQTTGLKDLAEHVLERTVEKPQDVTRSAWDAEYLSEDQIMYACVDASVSYEIGRKLEAACYRDMQL